jgi:hypothetical protein
LDAPEILRVIEFQRDFPGFDIGPERFRADHVSIGGAVGVQNIEAYLHAFFQGAGGPEATPVAAYRNGFASFGEFEVGVEAGDKKRHRQRNALAATPEC